MGANKMETANADKTLAERSDVALTATAIAMLDKSLSLLDPEEEATRLVQKAMSALREVFRRMH